MRIARTLTKAALVGGLAAALASAQPPAPPTGQPAPKPKAERFPVPKPDPAALKAAIAKGAGFLKATAANGGAHGLGSVALAGIALLEAGVPLNDPALQAATASIRKGAPDEAQTYHISLAILYLDRLGAAEDRALIQCLGVRLYGGLTAGGGFGYTCAKVAPQPAGQAGLIGSNPGVPPGRGGQPAPAAPPEKEKPANGFPQAPPRGKPAAPNAPATPAAAKDLEPAALADYLATRQLLFVNGRAGGDGDNSNTQFGMIALWVASRNGVPADDAFALIEAHFLLTQSQADAGWAYSGGGGQSTTAMTCAGLLGLAIGASRAEAAPKPAAAPAAGTPPNDPFYAPAKGAAPAGRGPDAARKLATDAALKAIGFALQRLATGNAALNAMIGLGDEYYTLWSVERMAVAYGLDTLGDVDWHALGCAYLLPQQQPDGSFRGGKHDAAVSTAFAVLFLAKANLTQGLTKSLKGKVKDPGKAELKAGSILDTVGGPRTVEPPEPFPGMPKPDAPPTPAAQDAAKLAQELTESAAFTAKLAELRDAKGGEHTAAIVAALPKLPAPKQTLARAALAERLTRMTAKTLRAMLADTDPELRRAASLACGAKGDAAHVGDLIRRLTDADAAVVQAAKAGLKTLTQQDFGPAEGADAAAREAAQAAWTKWHLANPAGAKAP